MDAHISAAAARRSVLRMNVSKRFFYFFIRKESPPSDHFVDGMGELMT